MTNTPPHDHHIARDIKYALITLVVVLIALVAVLFVEYRSLRKAQIDNMRESFFTNFIQRQGNLTVADANFIRTWMTFDYINKTFNLPGDYLKTQLKISDTRYPRLSISGYMKSQNLGSSTFLNSVIGAVGNYLTKK